MTKQSTAGQRGKSPEARFREKFVETAGRCWEWQSAIGSRGYGIFYVSAERPSVLAHRYAYELAKGSPGLLLVMHSCDNPRCVNPAHLSLGTVRDNAVDAKTKGRLATGERNGGGGKLTLGMVEQIRSTAGRIGCCVAAREFGVSATTIKAIRAGRLWRETGVSP